MSIDLGKNKTKKGAKMQNKRAFQFLGVILGVVMLYGCQHRHSYDTSPFAKTYFVDTYEEDKQNYAVSLVPITHEKIHHVKGFENLLMTWPFYKPFRHTMPASWDRSKHGLGAYALIVNRIVNGDDITPMSEAKLLGLIYFTSSDEKPFQGGVVWEPANHRHGGAWRSTIRIAPTSQEYYQFLQPTLDKLLKHAGKVYSAEQNRSFDSKPLIIYTSTHAAPTAVIMKNYDLIRKALETESFLNKNFMHDQDPSGKKWIKPLLPGTNLKYRPVPEGINRKARTVEQRQYYLLLKPKS